MTSVPQTIYTRADLKNMKAERDRQIHDQAVEQFVQYISQNILQVAQATDKTQFVCSRIMPTTAGVNAHKVMADSIEKLKELFVDVSIEYKFQTDIRTGREFNHGVYVDWS
jgi:hypothetical protein